MIQNLVALIQGYLFYRKARVEFAEGLMHVDFYLYIFDFVGGEYASRRRKKESQITRGISSETDSLLG